MKNKYNNNIYSSFNNVQLASNIRDRVNNIKYNNYANIIHENEEEISNNSELASEMNAEDNELVNNYADTHSDNLENYNDNKLNSLNKFSNKQKDGFKKNLLKKKKIGKKILGIKMKLALLGGSGIIFIFTIALLVVCTSGNGADLDIVNNFKEENSRSSDGEVTIGGDGVPYLVDDDFIHFFQYQYPDVNYGYGTTIASAGCCPTAMAMVLTNITGKMITPIVTADFSLKNGYRVKDNGTAWAFMPAVGSAYGVNCTQISTDAATIKNSLMSGNLISMSVNPGTFSSGGHFIVLRKVTDDGRIVVADPNSEARSKMAWDINIFPREAAAAWACSK